MIRNWIIIINTCKKSKMSCMIIGLFLVLYERRNFSTWWKHTTRRPLWARKIIILGYILYYFRVNFSLISFGHFKNIQDEIWHKGLQHNSCYLSNENNFSIACLCSFEWKTCPNVFCEITWIKIFNCNWNGTINSWLTKYFIKFCNYLNQF